jgi:hypothetical protein
MNSAFKRYYYCMSMQAWMPVGTSASAPARPHALLCTALLYTALQLLLHLLPPGTRCSVKPSAKHRFQAISDQYASLEQVQGALRREGLESCNLIVAVDCTKVSEADE